MANEKQLSLLIKETSKAKQGGKLVRWTIIAKVLNAKGPNIESGYWWKQVRIRLYTTNILTNLKPISFSVTIII